MALVTDFITFQKTIGVTATQLVTSTELAATDPRTPQTVIISAIKANIGNVFLGLTGVTALTGAPQLEPGDTVAIDYINLRKMFAIGTDAGDKIAVFVGFH